jgi:oxygen-independent coproporphyrinogen-3 oxidase
MMAGIYVHVPFCKKACNYCDFYHVTGENNVTPFLNAILKEAETRKDYLGNDTVSTIYFGGGTPSVLEVKELEIILKRIRKIFPVDPAGEITIEINPDDVTPGYFRELKKISINRISLGVQSWRDEELAVLNRRHTAKQAFEALERALGEGFENVAIDLIYGIPGSTPDDWAANLDRSLSTGITHLSAYHLTIEKGTVLGKMREKGLFREVDEDESASAFNILTEKTGSAGFVHYEISNFAKPGYISVHNSNYWKQVPYLGLGPSAHSFNGYSRQWNVSDLKKYVSRVNSGKIFHEREDLDTKARFNEYIMVSLRTMWGINLEYVEKIFNKEGCDYINNLSVKFIDYGLMRQENNNLILTNQGKMISDNIISEFMMPTGG